MASPNNNKSAEIKPVNQTGVINRARTTFNTIGDVWKQKQNAPTSPKPTKTTSSNSSSSLTATTNKTMDFFTIWMRHKKLTNKPKLELTDENSDGKSLKDKSKYNVQGFGSSATNTSSMPIRGAFNQDREKNILVDNSNKHQNKKKVMDTTILSSAHTPKGNSIHTNNVRNIKEKRRRHCLSRNTSLDLNLLAQENSTNFASTETMGQSFDDTNIDYSPQVVVNQRRNTFGESDRKWKMNRENYVLENEEINEDLCENGVIKAKLRLSKVNTRNESPVTTKPGILHRRNSIDSPATNRNQTVKNSKSESLQSDSTKENQLNVIRARKKLSFKEPVECSKFFELKSDTIPRATKFLEEYEEQRSGSLDFELEVCFVVCQIHYAYDSLTFLLRATFNCWSSISSSVTLPAVYRARKVLVIRKKN